MRQSTRIPITNGFRNLRISKRERKINKTDPLNDETKTVDPLDTSNTEDPRLGEEEESSGSSGCTATPDWCVSSGLHCYDDICDICANSFYPISCSNTPISSDQKPSKLAYSSYVRFNNGGCKTYVATFSSSDSGGSSLTFELEPDYYTVFKGDGEMTPGAYGPGPVETWQSGLLPKLIDGSDAATLYYRLFPEEVDDSYTTGETGTNPRNGEWFLDQWTEGTTGQAPTSCICTAPKRPIMNKEYELAANSNLLHQFYVPNNDGLLLSFYVTFDGTYINVFCSNFVTLVADKTGDVISVVSISSTDESGITTNTTTALEVTSMDKASATFKLYTIDLVTN
jgi:hypothetical protein